jgi:hypothetical protein
MLEGVGQSADDMEAAALPQPDRTFVAADDEVELHRPEAKCSGSLDRVGTHRACDAAPCSGRRDDIAAVRDMGAASLIVCAR